MTRLFTVALLMASTTLAGCSLAPSYERPDLAISSAWPDGAAIDQTASAADLGWEEVYLDPRLQGVIALALRENRDLRIAALNIEKARAQYRIQRAGLLPGVDASAGGARSRTPGDLAGTGRAVESESYNVSLGVTAYELDIFGRIRSLKDSALQSYLATAETRRAVQISLVGDTATAWLTMAADQDLLSLARETLQAREQSLKLIRSRQAAGATSMLEVRQGETLVEQARGDVAEASAQVAQDRNALVLLTGAEIPEDLLPDGLLDNVRLRTELPAGIPSEVLSRRPDVLSAEYNLKSKGANIGAARAAFFPRISLTGSTGTASDNLSGLFSGGSGAWSFSPSISIPIFDAGANLANLDAARVDQKIAVATYQVTVQTGFREVADALAVKATIDERVSAGMRLLVAATDAERLAQARYDQGVDSFLVLLDAQRSRYSAQQSLVVLKLIQAQNLARLFRSMGGGAPA